MAEAITEERLRRLADLTTQTMSEAERCAESGCFYAACTMAGVAIESGLLAHLCVFEPEVRAAGLWKDQEPQKDPFGWSLERLIHIAVKMHWLPATRTRVANEDPIDKLKGEVGDAVHFVQRVRNLAVHPGKHAYEASWLTIGQDEYELTYGIARTVSDHLAEALQKLSPLAPS